jgi:hypothetical protein
MPRGQGLQSKVAPGTDLSDEAFAFDIFHELEIGYAIVRANRITDVGGLGWERVIPARFALHAAERVLDAGAATLAPCCSSFRFSRAWAATPLARPVYTAFALVSVSFHWNNVLWPLIITNSVSARPLTVGLQVFLSTDQGIDWSVITAATLMSSAPLLIAFLLFQRQFVQSFMRAGIK